MNKAPTIIHQFGRPKKAKLLNGRWVDRPEHIFVPSYHDVFPTLDYDNHFVYYDGEHIGSTLMCTCGSAAIVVGYEAYRMYASYMGHNVIACMMHTQQGKHADGST